MYRLVLLAIALLLFACNNNPKPVEESVVTKKDTVLQYGIPAGDYEISISNIGNGDLFGTLLNDAGVDQQTIQKLISIAGDDFDVRKIKVGNEYEFFYKRVGDSLEPAPIFFVYEKDKISHVVMGLKDSLFVNVVEKDIVTKKRIAKIDIQSSLWLDMKRAGVPAILAIKLEDIFAWTIDFSGLQKGDSFEVLYDELSYKDELLDIGDLYYAVATHNEKVYPAVRYQIEGRGAMYWNETGESLKKAFLKAPLRFTRISSGFTYARRHPVLKIVRPHTGVDYAAPAGTPVMSIGDGVVIFKGWTNGGGNTVKIKHNKIYTTSYMHLKSFAKGLATGKRVNQGEVIGAVGSTGVSTGPHLDFRVYRNGTPINPLKMDSPAAEPLAKEYIDDFKSVGERYKQQMDSVRSDEYYQRFIKNLVPGTDL